MIMNQIEASYLVGVINLEYCLSLSRVLLSKLCLFKNNKSFLKASGKGLSTSKKSRRTSAAKAANAMKFDCLKLSIASIACIEGQYAQIAHGWLYWFVLLKKNLFQLLFGVHFVRVWMQQLLFASFLADGFCYRNLSALLRNPALPKIEILDKLTQCLHEGLN